MKNKIALVVISVALLLGTFTFFNKSGVVANNDTNRIFSHYDEQTEKKLMKNNQFKRKSAKSEVIEKEILSSKEDLYLEPAYGEYEIGETKIRTNEDTPDEYESNNSFLNAYIISGKPTGKPSNYTFSIDATLHIEPWYYLFWRNVDEDYYRFDVYADANVNIELTNIASGLDYDLELYKHSDDVHPSAENVNLVSWSKYKNNLDECINISLTPGTYYLRIYSYEGYSAWSKYNLSGSVIYPDINGSSSISDLRYNKGAGAAIWLSDLDPFKTKLSKEFTSKEVGFRIYDNSGSLVTTNYLNYENPFYTDIQLSQSINYSILYVWDLNVRQELYNIMDDWEHELKSKVEENQRITAEYELTTEIVNGVSTLVSIGLSLVELNPFVGISVAIGQGGISKLTAAIFQTIYPQAWETTAEEMLDYVRYLKNALECDSSTSSNEVVRLPVMYKYTTEHDVTVTALMHYYYLKFAADYTSDGYLYEEDIIYNYQDGGIYGGKVYGVRNYEDIEEIFDRQGLVLEDVNTGGNKQLSLNVPIIETINKGQYYWYNFTAPSRGEYTFYTEGECDTYGELFSKIVPAHSVSNRLDFNDDAGAEYNFSITRVMNANETIYLRVRGYSTNVTGSYVVRIEKTGEYVTETMTISPSDYGFEGTYNFNSVQKEIVLENGETILTNRLRCGYITYEGKSYLSLSAKRKNAGCAYLEYYFDQKVYSIGFDLALWSENEALNVNSSIQLQYLDNSNEWKTGMIFNTDDLSKSKDILTSFSYEFNVPTNAFRFFITTNEVNNDNNRGRIVVGDIDIYY